MSPRVRSGLIVGVIALVLTICVSAALGFCGPLMGLIAGAAAGFMAIRGQPVITRGNNARDGAVAGAIAGALNAVGQLIGGIASLTLVPTMLRSSGGRLPFGTLPEPGQPVQQAAYWISGLGVGACFGIVGVILAALAGAALAYLMTPDQPAASQPPLPPLS